MPTRRLVGLLVILAMSIGATTFFAVRYRSLRDALTRSHVERGRALAATDAPGAADEYRAALRLDRDDLEAGRALALVLVSLNRPGEADTYLRDLLRRNPTDGALNQGLARVQAARGEEGEARRSYQRAIYGEWPGRGVEERIATRFELIEFLGRLNARDEVLAELLRLRAELPPGRTADARRVAAALAEHDAAELALETLTAAAASAPKDVPLLAQLADLQVRQHQLAHARATLRRARSIDPDYDGIGDRLAMTERILALDPTLPGLRLISRTRRARLVLTAVLDETRICAQEPSVAPAIAEARRHLRRPTRASAEAAEQDLELAARVWQAAPCHADTPEARALAYVLARVAREAQS